jgi:hypothetical protein
MKPYQSSSDKENCSPISSNCIIWQGPNISCINLCKGDSVSDIVYKLAVQLCDIQANTAITEPNGVSLLQLDCLLQLCAATATPQLTTAAVLQLIIDKVCCTYSELSSAITELEIFTGYNRNGNSGGTGSSARSSGSYSEPILDLPPCLYYNDPFTGLQVTTLELTPYVVHLANSFCTLQATVEEHTNQITVLEGKVTVLETTPCCYTTPVIMPNCTYGSVYNGVSTQIDNVVNSLSIEYCALRNTLGTNTQLLSAAGSQCANLGALNALSQSGTMSSVAGWNNTINTFAQSMQNLWLTVCDMRGVINDLKACCGAANCSSFLLGFTVGSGTTTSTNLTLIFFPLTNIPAGYDDCLAGSTVTVTDGNVTFTFPFLLKIEGLDPAGINFDITSAGLNQYLPWTITVNGCIVNPAGTCNKIVSLVNPAITPTTTTTTAVPCTQYIIQISTVDLDNASGTVYVTYYDCDNIFRSHTFTTTTEIITPCVRSGYIPTLFYIADGEPVPCSTESTNQNTLASCPVV